MRKLLGSKDSIRACPPGYLLALGDDGTDVRLAERLLREGSQQPDPAAGVRQLREALALWRGRPLADLPVSAWLEEQAGRLDVLCVQVQRSLANAMLAAGQHAELIGALERMMADNPLDEQVYSQLMLALYRSGRQADALAVYHRLRRTLDEELGIGPGQAVRDLQRAILQQDPALDAPAPGTVPPASPAMPVPAQLPMAVPGFAGRDEELASLDAALPETAGDGAAGPAAVVISAVSGTAGVGKTALAVHWAHRVAGQFPDGQLYVNLRGFDAGGLAVDPGEAVRGFLGALGVPADGIPQGLSAQTGLYRSLIAGKRVLVILDNARDAEQVRPLLPGAPGCLALVTSRNQLPGLVAAEGASLLTLGLLTAGQARDLLSYRLGSDRVAEAPDAVMEIIDRCARLPLALTVAAARAATRPGFPLAAIAAELRDASGALDPFGGGSDLATDIRAVFSWSYRALSTGAARAFRLLGLHPGPDIAVAATASLAAVPLGEARALLAELAHASLLTEHRPGRYMLHDLLRAYAGELARGHDTQDTRDAAVHRVLDHYLHTSHSAAVAMHMLLGPITLEAPQPGVIVGGKATAEDALEWFTAEHATLLAAVHLAARLGSGSHTWQLAWALSTYLQRRGLWTDQAAVTRTGLEAARRAGDTAGQAHSLHRLAAGSAKSGRIHEARPLYEEALRLFERIGDHANQAMIHDHLAWLAGREHRFADMLGHSMQSLDLFRATGHQVGQAKALSDIGYTHARLGNRQQALSYCERALAAMQELGVRGWEGAAWDSLGYVHHQFGNYPQAVACYERALELARELADRFNEADTLASLGDVHDSSGDLPAARRSWAQALRIFDEIDHPDRDRMRAKIHPPGHPLPVGPSGAPPGRTSQGQAKKVPA